MSIENFRLKLKEYLRRGGYSQKQLAYELSIHPTLLSNKLNQRNYSNLTYSDVKQIVKTLTKWGALTSQAQALELLALMNMSYTSFKPPEWQAPPLAQLAQPAESEVLVPQALEKVKQPSS